MLFPSQLCEHVPVALSEHSAQSMLRWLPPKHSLLKVQEAEILSWSIPIQLEIRRIWHTETVRWPPLLVLVQIATGNDATLLPCFTLFASRIVCNANKSWQHVPLQDKSNTKCPSVVVIFPLQVKQLSIHPHLSPFSIRMLLVYFGEKERKVGGRGEEGEPFLTIGGAKSISLRKVKGSFFFRKKTADVEI